MRFTQHCFCVLYVVHEVVQILEAPQITAGGQLELSFEIKARLAFYWCGNGGREGIRTLETVPRLHTFQACAFDHSATRPGPGLAANRGRMQGGNRAEFSRPAPGPLQALRGLRKLRPHPKKRTAER